MDTEYTKNDLDNQIKNNEIVLIYFWSKRCGACNIHKPKISNLASEYHKIKIIELEVENNLETSSQYNIFTVPAVLVFVNGKEALRQARYINFLEITDSIKRNYDLLY